MIYLLRLWNALLAGTFLCLTAQAVKDYLGTFK